MEFSVMFFGAGGEGDVTGQYRRVLDVAREIDGTDIVAIWTPERHYHPFGGLFPQPAVLSAALAATTQHLRIRAGSVVAPLHRSVDIVEQWSVVDALSDGRVDLALASGWNVVDFWTDPLAFADRHSIVEQRYRDIQDLWGGHSFDVTAPDGADRRIRVYPTPVQPEVRMSLAASGNPETFRMAGRLGAGVLTHQLGQSVEQLAANVAIYREALAEAGHSESRKHVAVMLHTHLDDDREKARAVGTQALIDYLLVSIDLDLTERPDAEVERARRLEMARLRARHHVEDTALIGDFDDAVARLGPLARAGVDEVAMLIDFGARDGSLVQQARLLAGWAPRLSASLVEESPGALA